MIFEEQIARKPNLYPWTTDICKKIHAGFWTADEFNFQSDIQDFKVKLNEQDREIIVRALSAIGNVECKVKEYWGKLGQNIKRPEFVDLGFVIANTEVIHSGAYEKLLSVLGLEESFEENLKVDVIKNRINYLGKHNHKFHTDNKKQFIYSLILFTLFVENVSLFSQFYIINWFGRFKNVLKDTNQQTQYTRNEETLHALTGVQIINTARKEYPELFDQELEDKVLHESKEAFKYESEIVDWMIGNFEDKKINSNILKEFIKNRINVSLKQIGYNEVFEIDKKLIKNTNWFDEEILGNNMVDFFSGRPIDYSKKSQSFDETDLF